MMMIKFKGNKNLDQLESIFNLVHSQRVDLVNYVARDGLFRWFEESKICLIGLDRNYFDKIFEQVVQTFKAVGHTLVEQILDFVGFILLIDLVSFDFNIQPYRLLYALINVDTAGLIFEQADKKFSLFSQIDEVSDDRFQSSSDI
ncbi:hypothetical protein BpHYR1_032282, partial [Brachionus plicatilis]